MAKKKNRQAAPRKRRKRRSPEEISIVENERNGNSAEVGNAVSARSPSQPIFAALRRVGRDDTRARHMLERLKSQTAATPPRSRAIFGQANSTAIQTTKRTSATLPK